MSNRLGSMFFTVALGSFVGCESSTSAHFEGSLGVGDLSFLLPLDGPSIGADSIGKYGTVLPRARFDALEALTRVDEPDALYDVLEVVAVRLDPCFIEGSSSASCTSQIRVVLQPVMVLDGIRTTRDAAMHAFYEVPENELKSLAYALAATRGDDDSGASVSVHPEPSLAHALVLRHIGELRLTRVTAMSVHPSGDAWIFSGTDISGPSKPSLPMVITGVDMTDQHITSTGGLATLAATVLPDPIIEPQIAAFLDGEDRELLSSEALESATSALERLLDPAMHNPGTVDCASCHIATTAYRFATRDTDSSLVPAVYDDTRNQRMFGYFGATPSVSPRVLDETRAVLEWLATH